MTLFCGGCHDRERLVNVFTTMPCLPPLKVVSSTPIARFVHTQYYEKKTIISIQLKMLFKVALNTFKFNSNKRFCHLKCFEWCKYKAVKNRNYHRYLGNTPFVFND